MVNEALRAAINEIRDQARALSLQAQKLSVLRQEATEFVMKAAATYIVLQQVVRSEWSYTSEQYCAKFSFILSDASDMFDHVSSQPQRWHCCGGSTATEQHHRHTLLTLRDRLVLLEGDMKATQRSPSSLYSANHNSLQGYDAKVPLSNSERHHKHLLDSPGAAYNAEYKPTKCLSSPNNSVSLPDRHAGRTRNKPFNTAQPRPWSQPHRSPTPSVVSHLSTPGNALHNEHASLSPQSSMYDSNLRPTTRCNELPAHRLPAAQLDLLRDSHAAGFLPHFPPSTNAAASASRSSAMDSADWSPFLPQAELPSGDGNLDSADWGYQSGPALASTPQSSPEQRDNTANRPTTSYAFEALCSTADSPDISGGVGTRSGDAFEVFANRSLETQLCRSTVLSNVIILEPTTDSHFPRALWWTAHGISTSELDGSSGAVTVRACIPRKDGGSELPIAERLSLDSMGYVWAAHHGGMVSVWSTQPKISRVAARKVFESSKSNLRNCTHIATDPSGRVAIVSTNCGEIALLTLAQLSSDEDVTPTTRPSTPVSASPSTPLATLNASTTGGTFFGCQLAAPVAIVTLGVLDPSDTCLLPMAAYLQPLSVYTSKGLVRRWKSKGRDSLGTCYSFPGGVQAMHTVGKSLWIAHGGIPGTMSRTDSALSRWILTSAYGPTATAERLDLKYTLAHHLAGISQVTCMNELQLLPKWDIQSGQNSEDCGSEYIMTGHEQGAIRVWGVTSGCLECLLKISPDLHLPEHAIGGAGHKIAALATLPELGVIMLMYEGGVVAVSLMPQPSALKPALSLSNTATIVVEDHSLKSSCLFATPTRAVAACPKSSLVIVHQSGSVTAWSRTAISALMNGESLERTNRADPRQVESRSVHGGSRLGNAAPRHMDPLSMEESQGLPTNRSGGNGPSTSSLSDRQAGFFINPAELTALPETGSWRTLPHVLGEGAFGVVHCRIFCGQPVAVKTLGAAKGEGLKAAVQGLQGVSTGAGQPMSASHQEWLNEVQVMFSLSHTNVVQLRGIWDDPPTIITEYCPLGSLTSVLKNPAHELSWGERLGMVYDAACGMLHLHQRNIWHRDLKSNNLLVTNTLCVKVGDFGLSKLRADHTTGAKSTFGNPRWQAPEVLMGAQYSMQADVYSFGIIMWEVLMRMHPYEDQVEQQSPLDHVWKTVPMGARPQVPATFPDTPTDAIAETVTDYIDLMHMCWEGLPACRPMFERIVEKLLQTKDAVESEIRWVPDFAAHLPSTRPGTYYHSGDTVAAPDAGQAAKVVSEFAAGENESLELVKHATVDSSTKTKGKWWSDGSTRGTNEAHRNNMLIVGVGAGEGLKWGSERGVRKVETKGMNGEFQRSVSSTSSPSPRRESLLTSNEIGADTRVMLAIHSDADTSGMDRVSDFVSPHEGDDSEALGVDGEHLFHPYPHQDPPESANFSSFPTCQVHSSELGTGYVREYSRDMFPQDWRTEGPVVEAGVSSSLGESASQDLLGYEHVPGMDQPLSLADIRP